MRVFIAVLQNNLRRLAQHNANVILFFILTVGAVAAALFFNAQADNVGHIAVISQSDITVSDSKHLKITRMDSEPAMSELVSGRYDAIVIYDEQGSYTIKTIKNDNYRNQLETILQDPSAFGESGIPSRGSGTNIIGFMMMFVLMQGVGMSFLFAEDRDNRQIRRIAASPVPFDGYLLAHGVFTFAILFVPTILILGIARYLFKADIGFGISGYLALIAVLCALATSFGLFVTAVTKKGDSANMAGSASVVLTTVLSGSFYSFERGNRILEYIIRILPQKAFLSLTDLLEQGAGISQWLYHGLYIILLTAFFFFYAVIRTRKEYVKS